MTAILVQDFLRFAEQKRFFILRSGLMGTASLMVCFTAWTPNLSDYLVVSVVGTVIFLLLAMTPGMVAPALVQERSRGRLDVLRSTPVNGHHLVFGRFLARLGMGLSMTLALVPPLGFAFLFGGVSRGQFLLMLSLLLLVLIWCTALSLLASAFARDVNQAIRQSYGLVIGFFIITWLLGSSFALPAIMAGKVGNAERILFGLNPMMALATSETSLWPFLSFSEAIWTHAVFTLGVVAFALPLTTWGITRDPETRSSRKPKPLVPGQVRFHLDRNLLTTAPLLWLERRPRAKGIAMRVLIACGVLILEGRWLIQPRWTNAPHGMEHHGIIMTWWLIGFIMTLLEGVTSFHGAAHARTLEVLHSSPLPSREIIAARALGLMRSASFWWLLAAGHLGLGLVAGSISFSAALTFLALHWIVVKAAINLALLIGIKVQDSIRGIALLAVILVIRFLGPTILFILSFRFGLPWVHWIRSLDPEAVVATPFRMDLFSSPFSTMIWWPMALAVLPYAALAFGMTGILTRLYERRRRENWRRAGRRRDE